MTTCYISLQKEKLVFYFKTIKDALPFCAEDSCTQGKHWTLALPQALLAEVEFCILGITKCPRDRAFPSIVTLKLGISKTLGQTPGQPYTPFS